MFEKEAENSWQSKDTWYKVNADEQCYKTGFKDGYAKANEWQYPSKGKYPKENKRYLCKVEGFVGGGINYECFDYDTEYGSWKDACGNVIAWQEIVLPEEIKNDCR